MSPADSRWKQLVGEIEAGRSSAAHAVTDLQNSIARRLRALGGKGHCSTNAVGWIQARKVEKKKSEVTRIQFKDSANGRNSWGHPAVRLSRLKHLTDGAVLTVSIDVDARKSSIRTYSVSIEGSTLAASGPQEPAVASLPEDPPEAPAAAPPQASQLWYARVDLTEEREGKGICGHALLHCHVGSDPKQSHGLSPRVPLPWLHPADALDWLLATVDPGLEP